MTRVLTVLTPVHAAGAVFLEETRESVLSQVLPEGWRLEWVVQEDGPEPTLARRLADDSRIQYACNGASLGPAMTRNLALARSSGEYLQNLDADDLLLPGALAVHIAAIDNHPSVHWAWGQADDLMPDGSRKSFPPWIEPFGLMPAGRFTDWVIEHGGNWPIPGAGVMYRTATLRAVGGWSALPVGEDIAMLGAVANTTDGWQDPATTWLYRQHPEQISRHPRQPEWSEIARRVALQRIRALRLTNTHLSGTTPDSSPLVELGAAMKTPAELGTEETTRGG